MKRIIQTILVISMFLFVLAPLHLYAEIDKSELQTVYDAIKQAQANSVDYYPASYLSVIQAYQDLGGDAEVERLLQDEAALQEDVDTLANAIQELLNDLTLYNTFRTAHELYESKNTADLTAFTQRSIVIYQAELSRIRAILDNPRSGEQAILTATTDLHQSDFLLQYLGDKSAFLLLWTQLQDIHQGTGELYTPTSFALFQTHVQSFATLEVSSGLILEDVVDYIDASVDEVQLATQHIQDALSLLVNRANKDSLIEAYELANSLDLQPYTPASRTLYTNALVPIHQVIANHDATQAMVDDALVNLQNASTLLVLIADKSNLMVLNNQAIVAFYEERSRYTDQSHEVFRQAVIQYGHYLEVNRIIADDNASVSQVAAKEQAIQAALDLLVVKANISSLQEAYQTIKQLDTSPYTPQSILLFQDALDEVEAIILSPNTDQILADQTRDSLSTLLQLLVFQADKTPLQNTLQKASSLMLSRYTSSSRQTLEMYVQTAQTILHDLNATQADVDQINDHVEAILSQMLFIKPAPSIRANQDSFDLKDDLLIYETTIVSLVSSDESIVLVTSDGIVTGKQFGKATITVQLANGIVEDLEVWVKAEVKPLTIWMAAIIPLSSATLGFVFLFFKPSQLAFVKRLFTKRSM